MTRALEVAVRRFRLAQAFTIARGTRTQAEVVEVTISDGPVRGMGECVPYRRYGESLESVAAQIESVRPALEGLDRARLQDILPAGAARNALDCALWDLEAKRAGRPAWELAGLAEPGPVITAYTLSLDTPEAMRAAAAKEAARPLLKVKLGGGAEDADRLRGVRAGAPEARLILDANEGWDRAVYAAFLPILEEVGVEMVEQPFPAADDAALAELPRPVPVCADEAAHDRATLPGLAGKYDMVNIKLDKTGGLTEALELKAEAEQAGYGIMVGCMIGSSLGMAPAVLVAQGAAITDLDGPLLLGEDRTPPLAYDTAGVHPAAPALWG